MRLQCSVRTPRAKVSELVRNCHVSSRIKKTLLFHEALIADIETKIHAENTTRMSHSSFCHLHPFWVVHPYMSDRETWMCKLQKKLCQLKLTETSDLDSPTGMVHCDTSSKDCMYGESVKSVGTKLFHAPVAPKDNGRQQRRTPRATCIIIPHTPQQVKEAFGQH